MSTGHIIESARLRELLALLAEDGPLSGSIASHLGDGLGRLTPSTLESIAAMSAADGTDQLLGLVQELHAVCAEIEPLLVALAATLPTPLE